VVRMEDLDPMVSRREFEAQQLTDLAAIGLDWDGPVVRQSERHELYEAALRTLADRGLVYECYCTRKEIQAASQAPNGPQLDGRYPGTCRTLTEPVRRAHQASGRRPALRLRSQSDSGEVDDLLVGRRWFPIDDLVLRRNDGAWAYNLAVVVDDAAQRVGTVVRADDLLSSTPRQHHLSELLGLPIPRALHLPLIVNERGERLAKRDGAVTLSDRVAIGESPADVLRRLVMSLGGQDHDSVRTAADLLDRFSVHELSRTPWTFS
jgi:glutamyl-tRNA synthetase